VCSAYFAVTLPSGEVFLCERNTMNSSCKDKTSVLKEDLLIVSQREIAPRIFEMKLSGEMVLDMAPGQFLHLRVPDPSKLLRLLRFSHIPTDSRLTLTCSSSCLVKRRNQPFRGYRPERTNS
jgi:NAD(P)H-flavin reductase